MLKLSRIVLTVTILANSVSDMQIVEQTGVYSIRKPLRGKGFEVYRDGATAAVRVAIIGYDGDKGLQLARAQVERRQREDAGK